MATITAQINLLKLQNARRVQDGNIKGIFIPIHDNPCIYAQGKGAYLNIRIVEHESEYNDRKYSHFIAAAINKDLRDKLKEEGRDEDLKAYTPILGNGSTYGDDGNTYQQTSLTPIADGSELRSATGFQEEPDDLPFDKPAIAPTRKGHIDF